MIVQKAHDQGNQYVLFRHGSSTSRVGATTTRSQIRKLMQNKVATPFIVRKNCIQHETVFIVAIRPKK